MSASTLTHLHEICDDLKAIVCQDGLRMELDSLDRERLMPHAHDLTIVRTGGRYDEVRWRFLSQNRQRMVPHCVEWAQNTLKDAQSIVIDWGNLAMADVRCTFHAATLDRSDRLMAETDSEERTSEHHGTGGRGRPHDIKTYA